MDTTQVVATTFLPLYWKFFLIGFVGFILHVFKELKDKNIPEKTFAEYWENRKWNLVWGVVSYQILIWIWHDWTLIGLLSYVGLEIDKVSLNMGTIFIGYFSSSIMGAVITLWEFLGEKAKKIIEKRIDVIPEEKKP